MLTLPDHEGGQPFRLRVQATLPDHVFDLLLEHIRNQLALTLPIPAHARMAYADNIIQWQGITFMRTHRAPAT